MYAYNMTVVSISLPTTYVHAVYFGARVGVSKMSYVINNIAINQSHAITITVPRWYLRIARYNNNYIYGNTDTFALK